MAHEMGAGRIQWKLRLNGCLQPQPSVSGTRTMSKEHRNATEMVVVCANPGTHWIGPMGE